ncbi:uncharacterized protein LOC110692558 [Chenopodium quinoa]|uniref:uncharacterized protein LOC110692558 n=1 Tax=Chenopodium quinoa TaxID=63459 RepID=UPI000B78B07A|nr:uncharacterized protein LOC110692558 [Chenopodium quinoa]
MCIFREKRELTNDARTRIANWLLVKNSTGKLKRGTVKEASELFGVYRTTIYRISKQAKALWQNGDAVNMDSKKPKRVGKKGKHIDLSKISEIPFHKRGNIRALAIALGVSKSTIHRFIKSGQIKPHTNALKPALTENNIKERLKWCLKAIDQDNGMFNDMYNTIHLDEKWFYMTKGTQRYYLLPGETQPYRTCKSKRFVTKVMFLCAVARPQFNADGECIFDGKIGMFPFVRWVPAKRRSRNRPAGTLELKPVTSVTKEAYRNMLIRQVIPAIMQKWPDNDQGPIYLQQDNARPHIEVQDRDFMEAVQNSNKDLRLVFQPPNSPDMNVLDLGFFRAIQSLKDQTAPKNTKELVKNVKNAFREYCPTKGNRVFLSLQLVLIQVMRVKGSNNYLQKHVGKEALERQGLLPIVFSPSPSLVEECLAYVEAMQ